MDSDPFTAFRLDPDPFTALHLGTDPKSGSKFPTSNYTRLLKRRNVAFAVQAVGQHKPGELGGFQRAT
jgi:hypothetical protein